MALVIGLASTELTAQESRWLRREDVAGAILFLRNFQDRQQLLALVDAIRAVRADALLFVDQEGGRVQRFRGNGFIALPALEKIGMLYEQDAPTGRLACTLHAKLMVIDVLSCGIDMSFAPVADLKRGNLAIGNRAFSADAKVCAELTCLYVNAMQEVGMAATLKHFPGHGSVLEDTHFDLAVDQRPAAEVFAQDLLPFAAAVLGKAKAVMTAHVSYPAVDPDAAGYSKRWLLEILRDKMQFSGAIFSDDVGMLGGANIGSLRERIERHYDAGCDLILVCSPEATLEVMEDSGLQARKLDRTILELLRSTQFEIAKALHGGTSYLRMQHQLTQLLEHP
jgi:beta-N-acetylhexosaminidase